MPKKSFGFNPSEDADYVNGERRDSTPLTPGGIANAENGVSGRGDDSAIRKAMSGKGLYNPLDKTPAGKFKKAFAAVKKVANKKQSKATAGAGGVIAIVLFMVAGLVPHELNNFANNIQKEEAKIEQHMDHKLNQRIFNEIAGAAKKKGAGSAADKNAVIQEEAAAKQAGNTVTENIDTFPITDQNIIDKLATFDWHVQADANGNFKGLFDGEGKDITAKWGLDDLQGEQIDSVMHTWAINLLEQMRPELTYGAGVDLNILPADKDAGKDTVKEINAAVENGADAQQMKIANTEVQETPPASDATDAEKTAFAQDNQNSQVMRDAQKAVQDNYNKTGDAAQAQQAGEEAVSADLNGTGAKLSRSLGYANIASTVCSIDKDVTEAADSRTVEIATLLIRNAFTIASLASELNAGKLTSTEVSQIMKILHGANSNLLKNSDGSTAVSSKKYTSSAEWARVSGNSDAGATDISPSALPTKSGPQGVVDLINKFIPQKLVCAPLTSKVGFAVVAGADVIQFISNIGDFGASEAAGLAANVSFSIALETVIIPALVSYVGNIAVAPTQNPVALANNTGAGMDLGFNDYARHSGGTGQTNASVKSIKKGIGATHVALAKQQPWTYRTFAISNPDSVLSNVVSHIPIGTASVISGIASYLTSFPTTLVHSIASVFTPHSLFADSSSQCADPRCFTTYTIPDTVIDKYGPNEAGAYLFSSDPKHPTTVSYGGKTIRRIDALGNPNTYTESPQGDPNNDDILHCFVDPYPLLSDNSLGDHDAAKANCGSMGTFDMNTDGTTGPTNDIVAKVYCKQLTGIADNAGCLSSVKGQMNDDIDQYSVYLGYAHVLKGDISGTKAH